MASSKNYLKDMESYMKKRQIIDSKDQLVRDMTKVVSKSLLALGDKKVQLPWFSSSASYYQVGSNTSKKAS